MTDILSQVRADLQKNSDEHTRHTGRNFFKEQVELYGVKTAVVTAIAKKYFTVIKDQNKNEILDLCGKLWQSGYIEESFIACNWSYFIHKRFEESDLKIFEQWISRYVSNWASCDTLCNHTVGAYIEMYPDRISVLKTWAASQNRWMRRAAAVTLIIPARHGKFLPDIFSIANILLTDKDDLVQKGYGWMLKAASQAHQDEVFGYVMQHKDRMPRTALRYAIEKMPPELRTKAMSK